MHIWLLFTGPERGNEKGVTRFRALRGSQIVNLGGPWHDLGPFSVVNDFDVFASVHAWSTSNAAGVWPFLPQCNWIQQESCRICLIEGFSKSWAIREVGDSHFGKKCCTFLKKWCTFFLKKVMHAFPETRYIRQNARFFALAPDCPPKSDARFFIGVPHRGAMQKQSGHVNQLTGDACQKKCLAILRFVTGYRSRMFNKWLPKT